jgi:hypothetical protein
MDTQTASLSRKPPLIFQNHENRLKIDNENNERKEGLYGGSKNE